MPTVILVGGQLTSGKDAFADHLVDKHGFKKLGMSDTLAEALYVLNPLVNVYPVDIPTEVGAVNSAVTRYQRLVDTIGYVEAKKNPEVRRLLQVLGTEVGRKLLDNDIWVKAARKKISELTAAGHDVVITGIRFPNELALEQQLNEEYDDIDAAVSVWVDRPSLPKPPADAHASEASVTADDFQYVLTNDRDLNGLYVAADGLLDMIRQDWDPYDGPR